MEVKARQTVELLGSSSMHSTAARRDIKDPQKSVTID
jgi:hypothetical protein